VSGRSSIAPRPATAYRQQHFHPVPQASAPPRDFAYWAFAAQIWILVLGQKLVVPAGPLPLSLPFVALYAWLGLTLVRGEFRIAPFRLGLFLALAMAALATQVIGVERLSLPSLGLFLLLYFPIIFVMPVTRERYLQLLDTFQSVVVIGCAMVFLQLAWQAAFGLGDQPNLERLIPAPFLLDGYNYAAPIAWGHAFVRPNGYFFLEPSFTSAFIASALIVELMFFNRPMRILLYAAGLLGTVAATGVLMMLVAAPFLLARQNLRTAAATVFMGLVGLGVALMSGAAGWLSGRVSELSTPGSSGFERLVKPLIQLGDVYSDPDRVFLGMGAGNSVEREVSLWPIAKVGIEYGAVASVLFMAMIIVAMSGSRNRALAAALFVVFNFTGGFLLTPVMVILILFLVCLMPPVMGERGWMIASQPAPSPPAARPPQGRAGVVVPLRP
jgi:hypothetical protein